MFCGKFESCVVCILRYIHRVFIYLAVDVVCRQTVERIQMVVSFSSRVLHANSSMESTLCLVCKHILYCV